MPRVNRIEKARKATACGKCREKIPAGSPYIWIKPRYGSKRVRCTSFGCRFRPTDLSSAKTAQIEEAIEDAEDQVAQADAYSSIQEILGEVATVSRDVGEEYRDASSNWAGGTNDQFKEKADACESLADELESWESSGESDEDAIRAQAVEDGEDPDEAWDAALQELRDEAIDKLFEFSAP